MVDIGVGRVQPARDDSSRLRMQRENVFSMLRKYGIVGERRSCCMSDSLRFIAAQVREIRSEVAAAGDFARFHRESAEEIDQSVAVDRLC